MKYQEANIGSKGDLVDYLKRVIPLVFAGKLEIEGQRVNIPDDYELEFKVKYEEDEFGGGLSIKVSWDKEVDRGEEEEEEEEEKEDEWFK
ncbi:MAG: transcription initiation factor IIE [Clostridia bacterium]|nr:transcription initiation factor IIE [Clostridia bacterium]